MLGGLLRLTSCPKQLTEAHVAIRKIGEVLEESMAHLFGQVELACVNQVEGAIGHLVEPLALVIDERLPTGAGSVDERRRSTLLFRGDDGSSFVPRQAAMLIFLAATAGTRMVASDLRHEAHMSLLKLIGDTMFYHLLDRIDAELAETTRCAGCPRCSGVVHKAKYPRKPRGGPPGLPATYGWRASYCCAADGCRTRATPPSVRFLGRRVYLGAVVVLASALQYGVSKFRARQLRKLFGVSRQTLERWRSWWLETFPASRFWQSLRGRIMPGVDEATLPHSLLEQFEGSSIDGGALAGVLGLLQPISTQPWLFASAT